MPRAGKDLSVPCALGARGREGGEVELGRPPGSILPWCGGWGGWGCGAGRVRGGEREGSLYAGASPGRRAL